MPTPQNPAHDDGELLSRYFDLSLTGMAVTSPKKGWVRVNDKLCESFGYSRDELMQMTWAELTHPEDLAGDEDQFNLVLAGKSDGYSMEKRFIHKDGSTVFANIDVRCLRDAAGNVEYFVALVHDITDRKNLERQLRQALKMEAVGRLAGGIAHDFNNILVAINGYAEILAKDLEEQPQLHDHAVQIQLAGDRAARLTRQLLAFSRKDVRETSVLDLGEIVSELEQMLPRMIGEDIELRVAKDPEPSWIEADRSQMEQIIVNLVVNARDAMPDGGTLTISTANVDKDDAPGQEAKKVVRLRVLDTGVGMDAFTQSHIFEPFFTTKEQSHGTGLGLSTVYGIVRQSHADIEVISEPGHGTTFVIDLPRVDGLAPRKSTVRAGPPSIHRDQRTVLLVEDDPLVLAFVATTLERAGYLVIQAERGDTALRLASEHDGPIDLLLTDLVMPGLTGVAVAEQLQKSQQDLRVLFMSGYARRPGASEPLVDEDMAVLRKPFRKSDLIERVHASLDGDSTSSDP